MAHQEQRDFCIRVKNKFPDFFKNKRVLDIGSLDINGSNRDLFENCNYLGLDVGEGRNVDIVSVGHLFDGPDNYFDTIISTEVFEHDMFYEKTIQNVMRMLKPGGLFLFTCAAPGRPEHGTRRCGEDCAPLLIQISEEWADYYKNLEENDIRKIQGFDETFPDSYFELNNIYLANPADLYFYGIKGGERYLINNIKPEFEINHFEDHIFVIDCWPDNQSKENDLLSLIKVLKRYNIKILLTGHYAVKPEIQKMVDYYLYDKNNPLLMSDEFVEYTVASGRWTEMNDYVVENEMEFHHDYAIWEAMRNAFNFCNYLGKKYIHFFEYDNIPDFVQYRQCFLERIPDFDAVLYEYSEGSSKSSHLSPYCATYIFSIKTDIAVKVISQIRTKYEYFTNKPKGWQLERVFLECVKKITNNILTSNYIANNHELNTQAVWNRDGVNRNGAFIQLYLATDYNDELYIHFISGFHEKEADDDYLLEVNYGSFKKLFTLKRGEFLLEHIGRYRKGDRVKVYHRGVEVFNEFLGYDSVKFHQINRVKFKNDKNNVVPERINVNFVDGAYFEIIDNKFPDRKFDVKFIDQKTNLEIYSASVKSGWWCKPLPKYFVDWKIKINSYNFREEVNFDLKDKRVLVSFESKSLGDNIAWIPYVHKFRVEKKCQMICSTFHNELFRGQYPDIEFIEPGTMVHNLHGLYRIGLFYENEKFDMSRHPMDPKEIPLGKIASDILGLDYTELKPLLPQLGKKKNKRVCIATHSTSQCKYWNNPRGWQDVVDYLKSSGYEVRLLSREEDGYMGNKDPKGIIQQPQSSIQEILKTIQESELFIGISSGLSWLSWASGTPTILISGFTDDYLEPKKDLVRVINKNVCHGCWGKHKFDAGDWNWCPELKGTPRQFECSKMITSESVIQEIKNILG